MLADACADSKVVKVKTDFMIASECPSRQNAGVKQRAQKRVLCKSRGKSQSGLEERNEKVPHNSMVQVNAKD